jgi:hypothetical protein
VSNDGVLSSHRRRMTENLNRSCSYVMPSILLWSLVKKLPTTEKEGSNNYRDSLQALLDAREVDGDVEMADADQGNESDATVVGVSKPKIELSRPSSTLWDSATGEWMERCVGLSFEIVCAKLCQL